MNEEKQISYQDRFKLFSLYSEGSDYYFSIGKEEVRGPFVEELEAYQEAIRDMMELLLNAFDYIATFEDCKCANAWVKTTHECCGLSSK